MNKNILIFGTFIVAGITIFLTSNHPGSHQTSEEGWLTDFTRAKEVAAQQNKIILADFSGSDWCGWCIKLDQEVFGKKIFKQYAEKNLVLLFLDFPRSKSQSQGLKKQNRELLKEYGVRGFPTVLLLDQDGEVIAKTGYRRGGAKAYVEHLKKLIESTE